MGFAGNGPGEMTLSPEDRAAALAEVKAVARVTSGDDDALIAAFAETALGIAEHYVGRVLIARTMVETLDGGTGWRALGAAPVTAITGVVAEDGTAIGIEDHAVDIAGDGTGWVRVADGGRIRVTYQAGGAIAWDAIPAPVRQGAVLLAAHLYAEREGVAPPPAAITALWRPFRAMRLTTERRAC